MFLPLFDDERLDSILDALYVAFIFTFFTYVLNVLVLINTYNTVLD